MTALAAMSWAAVVVNPPARLAAPTTARPLTEDEVVGVDDPLQLGRGGVQLPRQGGQRDVHQGRVEVDEERREEQRREDQGFRSHS
jgi:hypothetical protein